MLYINADIKIPDWWIKYKMELMKWDTSSIAFVKQSPKYLIG